MSTATRPLKHTQQHLSIPYEPLTEMEPSSVAETEASAPPYAPNGVRAMPTTHTAVESEHSYAMRRGYARTCAYSNLPRSSTALVFDSAAMFVESVVKCARPFQQRPRRADEACANAGCACRRAEFSYDFKNFLAEIREHPCGGLLLVL